MTPYRWHKIALLTLGRLLRLMSEPTYPLIGIEPTYQIAFSEALRNLSVSTAVN